ncbi:STAS/SEC14 domain-containing protein (plasmid) [Verrucomicrobiaceae bacterium 227]
MLIHQILEDDNIVIVEPKGRLSEEDFQQLTHDVDQHLLRTESIKGLLIHVKLFPGWENLKGLLSHLRFVRDHHRKIRKVALASDSTLAEIIPKLADHFVKAEVKHFDFTEREMALEWLRSSGTKGSLEGEPPAR